MASASAVRAILMMMMMRMRMIVVGFGSDAGDDDAYVINLQSEHGKMEEVT